MGGARGSAWRRLCAGSSGGRLAASTDLAGGAAAGTQRKSLSLIDLAYFRVEKLPIARMTP